MDKPLYIGEDNLIEWVDMIRADTGAYVNDATVAFTVKNSGGTTVASGSCSYVAASDGLYQGIADAATVLTDGEQYTIELTASGTYTGLRRFTRYAMYHGAEC